MALVTRLTYDDLESIQEERPGDRPPRPAGQRDDVSLVSDDHGQPALSADHYGPLMTTSPDTQSTFLDALDWYGIWKLTDALLACAFAGSGASTPLGTPRSSVS